MPPYSKGGLQRGVLDFHRCRFPCSQRIVGMGFLPFPDAHTEGLAALSWACRKAARSPGWQLPLLKIQINNYPPRLHAALTCPSQGLPRLPAATIPAVLPKCTGGGRGSPWLPFSLWWCLCWGYPGPLLGSGRAGLHLTWCVYPIGNGMGSWSSQPVLSEIWATARGEKGARIPGQVFSQILPSFQQH